jgi:hypothetical protein
MKVLMSLENLERYLLTDPEDYELIEYIELMERWAKALREGGDGYIEKSKATIFEFMKRRRPRG